MERPEETNMFSSLFVAAELFFVATRDRRDFPAIYYVRTMTLKQYKEKGCGLQGHLYAHPAEICLSYIGSHFSLHTYITALLGRIEWLKSSSIVIQDDIYILLQLDQRFDLKLETLQLIFQCDSISLEF